MGPCVGCVVTGGVAVFRHRLQILVTIGESAGVQEEVHGDPVLGAFQEGHLHRIIEVVSATEAQSEVIRATSI